ncbi:MAG: NFACT RNA binding domain-containing protein [Eubacteriales bacterium]|nr:NFACT RNA binding domain-containing protein [Eubacteriales bacterium]
MPLDGLTLGFIARELETVLAGGRIDKIMQPFKDVLVMNIRAGGENHRLFIAAGPSMTRMHLTGYSYENPVQAPMFLMLMRKHLQGGRILRISQLSGDRLLRITISALSELGDEREKHLYFEAMGRHTNLTLVSEGIIVDSIRHVTDDMSRVRTMLPGLPFYMPPAQDKIPPDEATSERLLPRLLSAAGRLDKWLADNVSGLSAASAKEISYRLAGQEKLPIAEIADVEGFCERLSVFLVSLPQRAAPVLLRGGDGIPEEAQPFPFLTTQGFWTQSMPTLSMALDALYYEKDRHDRMAQRAGALRRMLKNAQSRSENRIAAQQEELDEAGHMELYRVSGELLTAFGHQVPKGADKAELPNYYDNNALLEIPLDPALTVTQNAQKLFKRYRKANIARRMAGEQIALAQAELSIIEDALYAIDQVENDQDIRDIRQPLYEAGILKEPRELRKRRKQPEAGAPLRFVSAGGLPISVGKNAAQNEKLLKTSQGDDLWLHAKDMPGSHVILHAQGRDITQEDIHDAALLAAYYSKAHGMSVPVDYTSRRYVRKTSGAPAGFVTFINNKTLLMDATADQVEKLKAK